MSAVDWRSEEDYANFEKAEAADIAWEWLRRDGDYHKDYRALAMVPSGMRLEFGVARSPVT
jgi:hypothetical protein